MQRAHDFSALVCLPHGCLHAHKKETWLSTRTHTKETGLSARTHTESMTVYTQYESSFRHTNKQNHNRVWHSGGHSTLLCLTVIEIFALAEIILIACIEKIHNQKQKYSKIKQYLNDIEISMSEMSRATDQSLPWQWQYLNDIEINKRKCHVPHTSSFIDNDQIVLVASLINVDLVALTVRPPVKHEPNSILVVMRMLHGDRSVNSASTYQTRQIWTEFNFWYSWECALRH